MQDQSNDSNQRLEEALAKAHDAFIGDPSIMFKSEAERNRIYFDRFNHRWKTWERPGPCMYRGCAEPSIRRSHSIHKAGQLERIAEAKHVLTPRLNSAGHLEMRRVGVNLASTFPGFCERHEQLFSEFETSGSISTARHVALQAFRTLCREIARIRLEIADLETGIEGYRKIRTNYYSSAVRTVARDAIIKKIAITGDRRENRAVLQLRRSRATLSELEGDLYGELFDCINNQAPDPCLEILNLPYEVSVACSGLGELTYKHDGKKHRAFCPLGILPQNGTTMTFIGAARKHSLAVEFHRAKMELGFGALNAMESWIINGSDHWFIRPSAWAAIPATRQANILQRIMSDRDNIGSPVNVSVLDDLRRWIISYNRDNLDTGKDRAKILQIIRKESAKLAV
jgi:hypothetical protein